MSPHSEAVETIQYAFAGDDTGAYAGEPPHVVSVADQTKKQTWIGRIWDTYDLPKAERRLMFKIDASLLVFASLGYFIKNLDQQNVSNAFLSGMKEDLEMNGNQLVTATSIWTAGYVIGQIPILLILTRVSPRWIIPSLELVWGILTLVTYCVKDYKSLYAIRFLVGLAESAFYPAMHYQLGSWYTPRELAKRSSIFYVSGSIGQMFSGILQSAAYNNLGGVGGLAGWRWIFIVDAIITLPIAILGFVLLPGLPWNTGKPFWLTTEEVELAQARMKVAGRKEAQPWTKARVLDLFKSWHLYALPIAYMLFNNAYAQQPMGYWLKSYNSTTNPPVPGTTFSVSAINQWPLGGQALFVVVTLLCAWWSDALGGLRWPFVIGGSLVNIIVNVVLISTPLYRHWGQRFAFYTMLPLAGIFGPLILNWESEILTGNNEARAVVIGTSNDLAYLVQAIAPNFIWKTTDFPRAHKGHIWCIALSAILIPWTGLIWFLHNRDLKKRGRLTERRDSEQSSASGAESSVDEKKNALELFKKEPSDL